MVVQGNAIRRGCLLVDINLVSTAAAPACKQCSMESICIVLACALLSCVL
jgi:hypothetical protein